jgi:tetrahydromethanopterin S-methyltransferase subunit E
MPARTTHIDPGNQYQLRRRFSDLTDYVNDEIGSIATNTGSLGTLNTQVATLNKEVAALQAMTSVSVNATTPASPHTEFTVTHTLGRIPASAVVAWISIAGIIYQGPTTGTAWTMTTVSLKCTVASATVQLTLS